MSIHTYKCQECNSVFDSIEKPGTKFAYCPKCNKIGVREGIELPNPPNLVAGIGGFHRPSHGTRRRE